MEGDPCPQVNLNGYKPIERYKTRVKVAEENKLFSSLQKNIIEFLRLNEQAQKFGSGVI